MPQGGDAEVGARRDDAAHERCIERPGFIVDDVSLRDRTTLGVGGDAAFFAEAKTTSEACEALAWARSKGLRVFVLGGGSNLVVSDRGFGGLVLSLTSRDRERNGAEVRVAAGHRWDELVDFAVREDLAGIECLSGIPGLVGATPIQNVGAYGQEVSETITSVEVIDRETGIARVMNREGCELGYRDSIFKHALRDRCLVVSVTFTLRPGGAPAVGYPELERHLRGRGIDAPSLAETRTAIIELRRRKSMVFDASDENRRSAGSFFMNPIVDASEIADVEARVVEKKVLAEGERMPSYPAGTGKTKLSAAWLIERAGFSKGTTRGRVGISSRHSLALVNRGGATATEVLAFAREVRDGVIDAFGVRLVPEPELVGFSPDETAALTG